MLTTNEKFESNDFNSELLDTSSNSCNNDGESLSDEDFLQTLSNDLDIPMLLDQNNALLNFDVEDDILSEVMTTDTSWPQYDILNNFDDIDLMRLDRNVEIKLEPCSNGIPDCLYSDSFKSLSPTPSQSSDGSRSSIEIKTENSIGIDTPPVSPDSNLSKSFVRNSYNKRQKVVPCRNLSSSIDVSKPVQRVHIQPKPPFSISPPNQQKKNPSENFMVKNEIDESPVQAHVVSVSNIISPSPTILNSTSKMVVLENVPVQKVTQVVNIKPVQMSSVPVLYTSDTEPGVTTISFQSDLDAKAIKRQQRMIKNRESACLSRKKKKDYLMSLEKEVSDLKMENQKLRNENIQLRESLYGKNKGISMQFPKKFSKNTAFLLAVLFTISINVGSIGGLFNLKNSNTLQADSDFESHMKVGRNLLWAPDVETVISNSTSTNISNIDKLPVCPMYVNQTESVRLAQELHRWIAKPYNISLKYDTKEKRRKKRFHIKQKYNIASEVRTPFYRFNRKTKKVSHGNNELQVFWPRPETLYSEFFEAIKRRDDTFYVVSFNSNNMLLPALYHNNTRRPKMSLLLPARLPNETGGDNIVSLMQIDCEVVDTRLINIKSRSIPQHYRHDDNFTKPHYNPSSSHNFTNDVMNATTNNHYKPYFIKNGSLKSKIDSLYSEREKQMLRYN